MSPTHECSEEVVVEKTKAVVRRLQAALAPSLFVSERPSDAMIVRELWAMLASDGVRLLLQEAPANQFSTVIHRAQSVVDSGKSDADIISALWIFMDEAALNDALDTDDQDEAPTVLVRLMMMGPYKQATAR